MVSEFKRDLPEIENISNQLVGTGNYQAEGYLQKMLDDLTDVINSSMINLDNVPALATRVEVPVVSVA
jgi:hypothetical protein